MASNVGKALAVAGVVGVVAAVASAAKSGKQAPPPRKPPKKGSFTPRHAMGWGVAGSIFFLIVGTGAVAAAWFAGFAVLAFIMSIASASQSRPGPHAWRPPAAKAHRPATKPLKPVKPYKPAKAAPKSTPAPPPGPTWADALADLSLVEGDLLAYELDPEALYLRKPLLQDATWPPAERFYLALARARDYADRYPDGRGGDAARLIRLVERAGKAWDAANTAAAEQGNNGYTTEQRAALRRIARCVDLLLDGSGGPHEALEAKSVLERLLPTLPGIGVPTPLRNQLALPAATGTAS